MRISRLLPLVGLVLFLYIIWNMDLAEIFSILKGMNMLYLLVSIAAIIPSLIIKAFKWKLLIKSYGIDYPLTDSITSWLAGFSISLITPGRVGDISRACYLKEKGISFGRALTTVVIDRIIDIITLFCLTITGIFVFITFYAAYENLLLSSLVIFLLFIFLVFLLTKKNFVRFILGPFFRRLAPERYKPKLGSVFNEFYRGLGFMRKKKGIVFMATIITVIAWFVTFLQYYFFALAINIEPSLAFLIVIVPITILLDALPISFSGIGTRDAALIFFFSFAGLSAESAISLSLVILFIGYAIIGFVGLFLWFKKPIRIRL